MEDKRLTFYKDNEVVAANIKLADSFFSRAKGLMFSKDMEGFDGLLIDPCRSIHTYFMNYAIDIVFMNSSYKVIKIVRNMPPRRLSWIYFRATQVLELRADALSVEVRENDVLRCE
jgi:uncharacterized membrane protein (UPF0127 family)